MQRIARPFIAFAERFYPDPFVFAIGLTVVVFFACLGLTDATAGETVRAWGEGLPALMAFIAQVALALVAGHALAHTDPARRLVDRLARLPRSASAAYAMVAVIAGVASLLAWVLGLIFGGLLAREIAIVAKERGLRLHYPLLIAAAYSGFVVWHMGYTGTIPLFVATPGHIAEEQIGLLPVTETIFAWWNIAIALATIAGLGIVMWFTRPDDEETIELSEAAISKNQSELDQLERELQEGALPAARVNSPPEGDVDALESGGRVGYAADSGQGQQPRTNLAGSLASKVVSDTTPDTGPTLGQRLDRTRAFNIIAGGALAIWLAVWFIDEGLNLTLDIVNWSLLSLALLLSRSPLHMVRLVSRAASSAGQIILQFPFYAGIAGMITVTGLGTVISGWFLNVSTPETLGFVGFLSAGFLNIFIPSGGGQWAIQGPIFIEAAQANGASISSVVMGITYGDQWTNMIQPFWTIPLLAIAGIEMRKIMGYLVVVLLVSGVTLGGGILLVGLLS